MRTLQRIYMKKEPFFSPSSDNFQNVLIVRTESDRERRRVVIRVDKLSESSAGQFPSIMTLMNLITKP